jgi:hypothetical protein
VGGVGRTIRNQTEVCLHDDEWGCAVQRGEVNIVLRTKCNAYTNTGIKKKRDLVSRYHVPIHQGWQYWNRGVCQNEATWQKDVTVWGCIQKFPDWHAWSENCKWYSSVPLGAVVSLFVSQSSEFCRHNHLCCFSTTNSKGKHIFPYRLSPETFGYTLVSRLVYPRVTD